MEDVKLWWVFAEEDGSFRYVQMTYGELLDDDHYFDSTTVIVHPDNPIYPKKLRDHNRQFMDYIIKLKVARLAKLVQIEAPEAVIAMEADEGLFSAYRPIFSEYPSSNEQEE